MSMVVDFFRTTQLAITDKNIITPDRVIRDEEWVVRGDFLGFRKLLLSWKQVYGATYDVQYIGKYYDIHDYMK